MNEILPSISKSDSSYVKQTYWQGRVWAPMNYLVYRALKYAGELDICEMLAHKSSELILKEWILNIYLFLTISCIDF